MSPISEEHARVLANLGCCGAGCKEDCIHPPCPCNLDSWTEHEKREIASKKRKAKA